MGQERVCSLVPTAQRPAAYQPVSSRVAPALGLSRDARVFVLERLRLVDGRPTSLQRSFLPAALGEEIALASSVDVEWVPNISPGFPLIPSLAVPDGPPSRDICFSCPADLDVLVEKLRPFAAAGAPSATGARDTGRSRR